jgi:hypothetical protein
MDAGLFFAGASEVEITPTVGLYMDGYIARTTPSIGVHDPLMAQVLVLESEGQRAAVVALDVLAVSKDFADLLRADLADLLRTAPDAVFICASHTHAGPAGLQNWFPIGDAPQLDQNLITFIRQRVADAAIEALNRLSPVQVSGSAGDVVGIGGDRNQPDTLVDTQVAALRFARPDGETSAVLFHYACHPTVMGADNCLYSADFPGAARQKIHEQYPNAICFYLNGAAGNISTRFFRRAQTFTEVERLGALLAERVLALLVNAQPITPYLTWASASCYLPVRSFPQARHLEATGNARLDTVKSEGAQIEAQLRQAFAARPAVTAALAGLAIGEWMLLTVPGEAFTDLALSLRAQTPRTLVVGYTNDYLGYFPTDTAIAAATYEALSSPYDARAHRLLQTVLTELARKLQNREQA